MRIALIMYYDEDAGELIEVEESLSFMREDSLMKADVIKDCIDNLQSTYDFNKKEESNGTV